MILHELAVEGFQCFAAPKRLGPLDARINIVAAPNGAGKSTLVRALVRALTESHRGGGRSMAQLRPRGRALTPVVSVTFEHGGAMYRLRKQFLDRASAVLERREGSAFQPLAEAEAANDYVRTLLLADAKSYGAGAALWCPQGSMPLPELTGRALEDIRRSLGAQVLGEKGQILEARAYDLYRGFYTDSGKLRGGRAAPRLQTVAADLERARVELAAAEAQMRENERLDAALRKNIAARAAAERRAAELAGRLEQADRSVKEYLALDARRLQLEPELRAAVAEYRQKQERMDRLRGLAQQSAVYQTRARELDEAIAAAEARIAVRRQEKEKATEALWQATQKEKAIRWKVEWTPVGDDPVDVIEGLPAGRHRPAAGEPFAIASAAAVEFTVSGPGRVRVIEGESAARHEERLRKAQDRVAAAGSEQTRQEAERTLLDKERSLRRDDLANIDVEWEQLREDGLTDEDRRREIDAAALRCHGAEAAVKEVKAAQAALPYDPATADRLGRELELARTELRRASEQAIEDQAVLRRAMSAAPYQKLTEAEERVRTLEQEYQEELAKADAVRLLWETIEQCKQEALAGLTGPVEQEAGAILGFLTGRRDAALSVSDGFQPVAMADFAIDELSAGETEQVYFATRLALAAQFAREERQLVVLDDVLTATDADRLARALDLIRQRSDRLQFLILTCHPERFAELRDAAMFAL